MGQLTTLRWFNLWQNQLSGAIPTELGSLLSLELLYLDGNELTTVPSQLGLLAGLGWLNLSDNLIVGDIPVEIWNLSNLQLLYLNGNQFTGTIPADLSAMTSLRWLNLSTNQLTSIPELTVPNSLLELRVDNNKLTFADLEPNIALEPAVSLFYSPQDSIGDKQDIVKAIGDSYSYTLNTGGSQNSYQWYKDGSILATQTTAKLDLPVIAQEDEGVYHCEVTNTSVTGLTLYSREITLTLEKCQELICNVGWNIVSSPVMPVSADMKDVFQPFIDNNSLIKIQDESGNTLEDLGIYGGWKNNIGDINTSEGDKIKMSSQDVINICGTPVNFPYDIELKSGWNIIEYPQDVAYDGMDAIVQPLIDNGTLIKVQDESGNTIEDLGIYGGWKNTIGDFVPGKGYKIKVNADVTLTIDESYPKSSSKIFQPVASEYFKPEFMGNGLDHMNIHFVNLSESGIMVGDEIGIFDGNTCVGSGKVSSLDNAVFSMIASANDETNKLKDGFIQGNNIGLRVFRGGIEYPAELIPVTNTSVKFDKNSSVFAQLGIDKNTAVINDI